MSASEYYYFESCTVVYATKQAVRILYEGDYFWFPLSMVADADDLPKKMDKSGVTVGVKRWLLKKEGWELPDE